MFAKSIRSKFLLWLAFLLLCLLVGFGVTAYELFAPIRTIRFTNNSSAAFPPWLVMSAPARADARPEDRADRNEGGRATPRSLKQPPAKPAINRRKPTPVCPSTTRNPPAITMLKNADASRMITSTTTPRLRGQTNPRKLSDGRNSPAPILRLRKEPRTDILNQTLSTPARSHQP